MRILTPLSVAMGALALLSLVNVSAYKVGVVHAPTTVTVTATGTATLGLTANAGTNSAYQATTVGGVLRINFGQSGNGTHSLQMGRTESTYTLSGDDLKMMGVFRVTNNATTYCTNVSVYVTGLSAGVQTNLTEIRGRAVGGTWQADTQLAGANGATTGATFNLGKSGSGKNQLDVDFHFVAVNSVTSPNNKFTVEVLGTQTTTCPP